MILLRLLLRAALLCALLAPAPALAWEGAVSFYGFESGRRTANGERFIPGGRTCAHWTLPFNTRLRVTDIATGRSIDCRVNDRGPHPRLRRALDLSHGAAAALGVLRRGVFHARIAIIRSPSADRLRLAEDQP